MELDQFVSDFAAGIQLADRKAPQSKQWRPGIGPHDERDVIRLVMQELGEQWPDRYGTYSIEVPYPASAQSCDLCLGNPPAYAWAFEIKALRLLGDKGHAGGGRDDVSKILSPYPQQRSALTDCAKLTSARLGDRQAIVIYAYDWPDFPALAVVEIFEMAATQRVTLGARVAHHFHGLIHPVHQQGSVYGWELLS